ncbi:hypothetical protein C0J07_12185 [Bordetella avium]|nr:hypothetical protein C0J07_12185 [Bordetella avium]
MRGRRRAIRVPEIERQVPCIDQVDLPVVHLHGLPHRQAGEAAVARRQRTGVVEQPVHANAIAARIIDGEPHAVERQAAVDLHAMAGARSARTAGLTEGKVHCATLGQRQVAIDDESASRRAGRQAAARLHHHIAVHRTKAADRGAAGHRHRAVQAGAEVGGAPPTTSAPPATRVAPV